MGELITKRKRGRQPGRNRIRISMSVNMGTWEFLKRKSIEENTTTGRIFDNYVLADQDRTAARSDRPGQDNKSNIP